MLVISYDISENKVRTRFSKFLSKYGYRIQYSVFRIKNSDRIINIIKEQIESKYMKQFTESDSVLIYTVDENKVISYGYAKHEDETLIML